MAKKNSFLDAIDELVVEPRKIEGIQIGENYSGLSTKQQAKKAQIKPSIDFKTEKPTKAPLKSKTNAIEPLKRVEPVERPRKVKLKPKIVNKPEKREINRSSVVFKENVPLDVNLLLLNGLSYDKKIEYFATNGFWIQLERFKGVYWEVATRFINRKKYKIYVKELIGIPNYDDYSKVDMLKIKDMTADERRIYLCRRGWSIKALVRGESESQYEYATKYINRKKKHIYIGTYVPGTPPKQIFL
jgi:hypothetical protein